ncbi:hypothetical protein EVAR_93758_1 [Eumeta japonica]|uniref:Uncharacterized protein n=1 Tax=Eumeta variegata TaxID=151549 RepID=A0A4C2AI74_EUMVA|nr:hypothetical protein EVAR_93758_1 [Eumeta japonica]
MVHFDAELGMPEHGVHAATAAPAPGSTTDGGYDDCREGSDERSCGAVHAGAHAAPPRRPGTTYTTACTTSTTAERANNMNSSAPAKCVHAMSLRQKYHFADHRSYHPVPISIGVSMRSRVDCLDGPDEVHRNGTAVLVHYHHAGADGSERRRRRLQSRPRPVRQRYAMRTPAPVVGRRADCADAADEGIDAANPCAKWRCARTSVRHRPVRSLPGTPAPAARRLHLRRSSSLHRLGGTPVRLRRRKLFQRHVRRSRSAVARVQQSPRVMRASSCPRSPAPGFLEEHDCGRLVSDNDTLHLY